MEEGTIRMPKGAHLPGGRENCQHLAAELERWTGIKTVLQIDAEYDGPVDMLLNATGQQDTRFYHVAPWFSDWLCYSTLTPSEIKAKAIRIATHFRTKGVNRFVYRGEHKCFPSVQSAIARHYCTNSEQAIALIVETQVREARQRSNEAKEMTDLDIQVAIQHLGGKTNLIDFSKLPWVALYFACTGVEGEAGRLLSLDVSRRRKGLAVHHTGAIEYPVAKERLQNQLGVLVEPRNGVLADRHFHCVERIEPEEKDMFRDLLEKMGICHEALFSDLVAYATLGQHSLPCGAYVHMMAHWLRTGAVEQCWRCADYMVTEHGHESPLTLRAGLYYRGIASALRGRFEDAHRDLIEAKRHFDGNTPKIVEANHRRILALRRSRDARRLRKKLNLTVDKSIFTVTIEGYRHVE